MFRFTFSCELLEYVLLIQFEFFSSVGESEQIGIASKVKCDRPIPMCSNWFGHIFHSKFKFDFSDGFSALVVSGSGTEAREDIVEINDFPLNEVEPFGVRESRASQSVNNA